MLAFAVVYTAAFSHRDTEWRQDADLNNLVKVAKSGFPVAGSVSSRRSEWENIGTL